jgi:hypothetical protein
MARSQSVRLVKRLGQIARMDRHLISKATYQGRTLFPKLGHKLTANNAYALARLMHSRAGYSG